ncbi:hypothetical protein HA397_30195, partial [Escherichia coli]|nr:hypothetical protein [Escherichia coli]
SNIITWGLAHHSRYLWTLPMFHCNGWCFPWAIAANAGVCVCLRAARAEGGKGPRSALAEFHIRRLLPEHAALLIHAAQGAAGLYALSPEDLSA